jgi:predicted secreted protein
MASAAKTGIGAQLKRGAGDGPPETFTKIAEIKTIKGPAEDSNIIDVTNLDSTGGYEEYIQGLKKGGVLSMDANFIPGDLTYLNCRADFQAGTKHNWQVVLPSALGTFSFLAFVSKLDHQFTTKDAMSVTIDLQITGTVTLA